MYDDVTDLIGGIYVDRRSLPPNVAGARPIDTLLYDASGRALASGTGDRPFTPPAGLRPVLLAGSTPRATVPPFGANLATRPRSGWPTISNFFDTLRLASGSEFVRAAINDIKGQIEGMAWDIVARKGIKSSPALESQIENVRVWLRRPDPGLPRTLRTTISSWIEEILVTDALTLLPRFSRGGEFLGLEQIDGGSIQPWVDSRGRPPAPGTRLDGKRLFAYVQWAHGRPETGFDIDTGVYPPPQVVAPEGESPLSSPLWYLPRNPRPDAPYGRPEVEMLIITINLAMRQQLHDLAYYTDRKIPEGLYQIDEWPAEKIEEFQSNYDATIGQRGAEAMASDMLFLPKGTYQPTKTRQWDYQFFEAYMRMVAWVFQVSPTPIAKQTGLGGSQSDILEQSVAESGTRPKAEFIAEIFTAAIQGPMGYADLEFRFGADETEDSADVAQRNVIYFGRGGLSLNEFYEQTGGEPIKGDDGNLHLIDTPSGPVFLEDLLAQRRKMLMETSGAGDDQPDGASAQTGNSKERAQTDGDAPLPDEADAKKLAALATWRRVALDRHRLGKRHREFEDDAIPHLLKTLIQARLESAMTSDLVRAAFDPWIKKKPTGQTSPHSESRTASSGGRS